MNLDKIFSHLGSFGRYQLYVYILACIPALFCGTHMLANVFLMGVPRYRCHINECENDTSPFDEPWEIFVIPKEYDNSAGIWKYSGCNRFMALNESLPQCTNNSFSVDQESCSRWKYETSVFTSTAVSEWDLVCEKEWLVAFTQSMFMVGAFMGSFFLGLLGDRWGRRISLLLGLVMLFASSVGTYFSNTFVLFLLMRFFTAFSISGLYQSSFILAIELVGPSSRVWCGNMIAGIFSVGELILALAAYYYRTWPQLQLVLTGSIVFIAISCGLMPESLRWLISKGKFVQSKKLILKAASWNKVHVPEDLLEEEADHASINATTNHAGFKAFIFTPRLAFWTINIAYCWLVNSMIYYGLSLGASELSGDIYLNFVALAVVEMPGIIMATFALRFVGRKTVLFILLFIGGISCGSIAAIPPDSGWIDSALAVLGKSSISASFAVLYVYSAEIFPTIVRNTGIGLCTMASRFGSIVAPFLGELKRFGHAIPFIVFGALALISALLVLFLPETQNHVLPETLEDLQKFGKPPQTEVSNSEERMLLVDNDDDDDDRKN